MKIETIQITSDAFYWLRDGEEMIDTDNEEEAQEIVEMFKPHFEFISEPIPVDGTDMVEVKISVGDRHILAGTSVADFTPLPTFTVATADGYLKSYFVNMSKSFVPGA